MLLDGKRAGGVGRAISGSDAGAELHQVKDVAREQRNAIDGLGGDELAHCGVAGVDQGRAFSDRDYFIHAADPERDVHCRDLVDRDVTLFWTTVSKPFCAGRDLIGSGGERDERIETGGGRYGRRA